MRLVIPEGPYYPEIRSDGLDDNRALQSYFKWPRGIKTGDLVRLEATIVLWEKPTEKRGDSSVSFSGSEQET